MSRITTEEIDAALFGRPASCSRLTTRATASGVIAAYAGHSRVGCLAARGDREWPWMWELTMTSEQHRGYPRGVARTRDEALADLERMLTRWMRAAGMEWKQ